MYAEDDNARHFRLVVTRQSATGDAWEYEVKTFTSRASSLYVQLMSHLIVSFQYGAYRRL